ncbi:GtrA family protein [Actibacterium lipolyticum]|nr:GtrA family protein [Actibacterium lipolyticum]
MPNLRGQIGRYILIGLLNTGVGLAVIFALHVGAELSLAVSNAVGYFIGWLLSYVLNRSWTFAHSGSMARSLPLYLLVVLVAFGVNLLVIVGLQAQGIPYVVAQISGAAIYSILTFIGAKIVVFSEHS